MNILKAHAFGNDFLLAAQHELAARADRRALARRLCNRHRGLGGDGLILYEAAGPRASMQLLNADGSYSEISGNGVRCLAAAMAREAQLPPGSSIVVETDAGAKTLELLDVEHGRYTFRAAMGHPERVEQVRISLGDGEDDVEAVTLRVGNPQCVVLGEVTEERLRTVAARLAVHPRFPEGTNVELARVEPSGRVRILIWERGVGPTEASGTGACAAAVAAIQYGGARRDVEVESPGGTQRVEWRDDGLFLTGWAEVLVEGRWIPDEARA